MQVRRDTDAGPRFAARSTLDSHPDGLVFVARMRQAFSSVFALAFIAFAGCRTHAPLHVWIPPTLESAVGKKVVLAGVKGPAKMTEKLEDQIFSQAPSDIGRQLQLVAASELEASTDVRLVSASDEDVNFASRESPMQSDVTLHHLAKQSGYDFVLRGEVLTRTHQRIHQGGDQDDANESGAEPLTISWQLSDVTGQTPPIGQPISLDLERAIDLHPDLAFTGDPQTTLLAAAARETNRLILPSIDRNEVRLSVPYGLPGSRAVRRGNKLATAGRWEEAKQIWETVADENPLQVSALVNLSLAHAAEQDFTTARTLVGKAIRRAPSKLAQETLVWIELRQRDYHRAFGLPDPAEGWFVTR